MATDISDYSTQKKSGCGIHVLYNGVFGRKSVLPRRTVSISSIPIHKITNILTNTKLRRAGSCDTALLENSITPELPPKPIAKTTKALHQRKPSNGNNTSTTTSTSTSSNGSNTISKTNSTSAQGLVQTQRRSISKESSIEEVDGVVREKPKGSNALVRTSSGNLIVSSQLGNIKLGNSNSSKLHDTKYGVSTIRNTGVMGNIVLRKTDEKETPFQLKDKPTSLYRTLSKRIDPDRLKVMGNEEYKKGRFAEALAFYDKAINFSPDNALYRSNKSAALIGLGRLLEASFECIEAIRIDPFYQRAHHRLATLYIRLGEGEKALQHFKQSGFEAKSSEISKAQVVQFHYNKCIQAKKQNNWQEMLNESECIISLGTDSAQEIFLLQAEALLQLRRHKDADNALTKRPTFNVDDCTKFFGPGRNAQLQLIQAKVDMAAGRFDEAVVAAEQAQRLDPTNREVSAGVRMIRAASAARSAGNKLYNASKFSKASMAYSEGLEHEPFNSVLLCNRAACRFKLCQFEKAMEDCTSALNLLPSYTKARLRRAECNAKMERWEASIQDYEILMRENPGDEEMGRSLFEAQVKLMKQRAESGPEVKIGAEVGAVSNNQRIRHMVTSPAKYVRVGG